MRRPIMVKAAQNAGDIESAFTLEIETGLLRFCRFAIAFEKKPGFAAYVVNSSTRCHCWGVTLKLVALG